MFKIVTKKNLQNFNFYKSRKIERNWASIKGSSWSIKHESREAETLDQISRSFQLKEKNLDWLKILGLEFS